jgi:hypothetical protein
MINHFKPKPKKNPRQALFLGGRKSILLLEGSQEMSAGPSYNYRVRVKTLW